jgi:hypothetical protein
MPVRGLPCSRAAQNDASTGSRTERRTGDLCAMHGDSACHWRRVPARHNRSRSLPHLRRRRWLISQDQGRTRSAICARPTPGKLSFCCPVLYCAGVGATKMCAILGNESAVLRQRPDQDQLVAHRDPITAQQWDRGLQLSCSVNRTRIETSEVETAALIQTKGVDVVVGRHQPQLAPALRCDRRSDGFD